MRGSVRFPTQLDGLRVPLPRLLTLSLDVSALELRSLLHESCIEETLLRRSEVIAILVCVMKWLCLDRKVVAHLEVSHMLLQFVPQVDRLQFRHVEWLPLETILLKMSKLRFSLCVLDEKTQVHLTLVLVGALRETDVLYVVASHPVIVKRLHQLAIFAEHQLFDLVERAHLFVLLLARFLLQETRVKLAKLFNGCSGLQR